MESHFGQSTENFERPLDQVRVTDFFGHVTEVRQLRGSYPLDGMPSSPERGDGGGGATAGRGDEGQVDRSCGWQEAGGGGQCRWSDDDGDSSGGGGGSRSSGSGGSSGGEAAKGRWKARPAKRLDHTGTLAGAVAAPALDGLTAGGLVALAALVAGSSWAWGARL
jgi:hypothetical protein